MTEDQEAVVLAVRDWILRIRTDLNRMEQMLDVMLSGEPMLEAEAACVVSAHPEMPEIRQVARLRERMQKFGVHAPLKESIAAIREARA